LVELLHALATARKDPLFGADRPGLHLVAKASPAYLTHGVSQHPQDSIRHICINMRHETAGGFMLESSKKDGQALRVRASSN
ncbi:MAG: hypothetical protein ACTHLY_10225, partial [Pseudolabrys sp.]